MTTRRNGDIADRLRMAATEVEKAKSKDELYQVREAVGDIYDSIVERLQS